MAPPSPWAASADPSNLSPPGRGSPHTEQPASCPSPRGTVQPRPPRSLACPPTTAGRAVLAERGYLTPLPRGTQDMATDRDGMGCRWSMDGSRRG